MKEFLPRVLALVGLILISGFAYAQQGVCVYKDSQFNGPRRCFEHDVANFKELGINDQISSFQLHGNVAVIFYEHSNYRGANKQFSYAEAVLSAGMNDNFSSMRIIDNYQPLEWGDRGSWGYKLDDNNSWNNENTGYDNNNGNTDYNNNNGNTGYDTNNGNTDYNNNNGNTGYDNNNGNYTNEDNYAACLYPDENYRGQEFCFTHDDPRFEIFAFDNKADSLRIIGDIEVELFQHADYKGFSRVFRKSVPRFQPHEHDQFSAIRIRKRQDYYDGNQTTGQVCLYADWYFVGQPYCFTQDNPRFADFGFDNKADSIRIEGDIEVILYQHENYKGYSRVFRSNVPQFQGKDHDQYSSIRIRHINE